MSNDIFSCSTFRTFFSCFYWVTNWRVNLGFTWRPMGPPHQSGFITWHKWNVWTFIFTFAELFSINCVSILRRNWHRWVDSNNLYLRIRTITVFEKRIFSFNPRYKLDGKFSNQNFQICETPLFRKKILKYRKQEA